MDITKNHCYYGFHVFLYCLFCNSFNNLRYFHINYPDSNILFAHPLLLMNISSKIVSKYSYLQQYFAASRNEFISSASVKILHARILRTPLSAQPSGSNSVSRGGGHNDRPQNRYPLNKSCRDWSINRPNWLGAKTCSVTMIHYLPATTAKMCLHGNYAGEPYVSR